MHMCITICDMIFEDTSQLALIRNPLEFVFEIHTTLFTHVFDVKNTKDEAHEVM